MRLTRSVTCPNRSIRVATSTPSFIISELFRCRRACQLSVPKILTPYIPEILSLPAIAGKVRNLPMLRFVVVSRAERREEGGRDVEATRDRRLAEGWPG